MEITQDNSDFNKFVQSLGTDPVTVVLKATVTLKGHLTLGPNIQLIVRKGEQTIKKPVSPDSPPEVTRTAGRILLKGHKLTIAGAFEAASFQVFEYKNKEHKFGETEGVVFKPRSVERVDATWFGTDPSFAADSTYPLQRAIDAARLISRVFLPSGKYRITDTIHLGINDGTGFQPYSRMELEGVTPQGPGGARTWLEFLPAKNGETKKHKNRPLINIQHARDTVLRNLKLFGSTERQGKPRTSAAAAQGSGPKSPRRDDWVDEDWTAGRYNPYCGVATDAYVKGTKENAISSFYPEAPERGVKYQLQSGGSAIVLLENVDFFHFAVGFAIAPGGNHQNDTIFVKRCHFDGCTYGVAVGAHQARGCHIQESGFVRAYAAVTTIDFGSAAGGSLLNLSSNTYGHCRSLYRMGALGGGCHIAGEYCENVVRLGTFGSIGGTGISSVISFAGCHYELTGHDGSQSSGKDDPGPVVDTLGVVVNQNHAMHFQACEFRFSKNAELALHLVGAPIGRFAFESCTFRFDKGDVSVPKIWLVAHTQIAHFAPARQAVSFDGCTVVGSRLLPDRIRESKVPDGTRELKVPDRSRELQVPERRELQAYDLSNELRVMVRTNEPVRQPIHWSTTALRVSGGLYGETTLLIRNTIRGDESNPSVFPIVQTSESPKIVATQDPKKDPHKVLLKPTDRARFRTGDRLLYMIRYHPDEVYSPGANPKYPILVVTSDEKDREGLLVLNPEGYLVAEVPVTSESYQRDFSLVDDPTRYISLFPRTDFADPMNSQLYVILNGSVTGRFAKGLNKVTNVKNIHLLREGDFLNTDFVPNSGRIKSIHADTNTIVMTARAKESSSEDAHLPAIYVRS